MERDYHSGLNNADRPVPDGDGVNQVEPLANIPLHPLVPSAESPGQAQSHDQDSVHALGEFAAFVGAMKEKDYGDWMRRANVYWDQLRLKLLSNGELSDRGYVERQLSDLKKIIQYTPNWQVLETQRAVIEKVLEMRRHFGGGAEIDIHDLELSTSMTTPPEGSRH